jgi:predicted permease
MGFGAALTLAVTLLFGLAPALRASAIKPASTLKGGEDPHSRRRLMHALIAVQAAFCFLVLFVAGLFAASFERLSGQPMGFSPDRLLTLTVIPSQPQLPVVWSQVAEHLRAVPGVEKAAVAGWPLLSRNNSMNSFVSVNGAPPGPVLAYFLNVSPGWTETMRIPFVEGRDFRPEETTPGAAIVNETFVREFFHGESPIGKSFVRGRSYRVVGVVRDSPYRSIHEPILPVAYTPLPFVDANGAVQPISHAAFIVRTTASNPLAMASILRQEIPRARAEFRVSSIGTQSDLVRSQTLRERMLATLAVFFAGVALLLAGIGLYGVLDYSVLQRRREIGIRMAIGAQAGDIARRVTADVFGMVLAGAVAGLALGMALVRYIEGLLYHVKPNDLSMMAIPASAILAAALLAALPAVVRAVRLDPVATLRGE